MEDYHDNWKEISDEKSIAIVKMMLSSINEVKEKVMNLIKACEEGCYCDKDQDPLRFTRNIADFGCYFGPGSIPQLFFYKLDRKLTEFDNKVDVAGKTNYFEETILPLLEHKDKIKYNGSDKNFSLDCSARIRFFISHHRTFKIQEFNLDDVYKLKKESCGDNPYYIGSILFIGHQLAIVAKHGQYLSTDQNNVLRVLAKDIKDYALGSRSKKHTFDGLRKRLHDFITLLDA